MVQFRRWVSIAISVLFLAALPLQVIAAYAVITTQSEPSSVQLFEYYSDSGTWEDLKTPFHNNSTTGEIAYCLEHKGDSPHGTSYSEFDPTWDYPPEVYEGLIAILNNGYPAGGSGGLTADQARYATANAIRMWLSEMQVKHGRDFQQYNFMNLSGSKVRAKSGSTAQAMWTYALNLVNLARSGASSPGGSISVTPTTVNLTPSGSSFTGSVTVQIQNLDGYTYNAPSGITVSGFTGKNGDRLTFTVPTSYAGQRIDITFTGTGSTSAANYAWYQPSNSDQKVVLVGNSVDQPAVDTKITLVAPDKGGILIDKTDDLGNALTGATFRITNSMGQTVGTVTSDSIGYAELMGLDAGTYYIEEISAPPSYLLDSTIRSVIVTAGQTQTVYVSNTKVVGYIDITKVNSNPSMGTPALSGGQFDIINSGGQTVDTVTLNASGKSTSKALPLGTYTVRERVPPTGFVAGSDQTVTLSSGGQGVSVVYGSVTIPNAPQVGQIRLKKTNANPALGDYSLAGCVFELRDWGGTLVDTITTSATGDAISKDLKLGTYTITEKTVPNGFTLNTSSKSVTLSYGSPTASIVYGDVSIANMPQSGQIQIKKINSRPEMGDYPLSGAVFDVVDNGGKTVDTLTTDVSGECTSKLLPLGSYTVVERTAPANYFLNPNPFSVNLTYAGQTVETVYGEATIGNAPQTGVIRITKQDKETGDQAQGDATLSGGVFDILDTQGNLLQTLTMPDDANVVESDELPLGDYIVREKVPPTGYTHDPTEYPVTILYKGQDIDIGLYDVTIKNEIIRGKLSIIKFMPDQGNQSMKIPLGGVEFTITRKSTGETVGQLTTDDSGYAMSELLVYGTYVITETKTADDLQLLAPFEVFVSQHEKLYAFALENSAYKSELRIVKKDAATGQSIPAAGVKFRIKDESGEWIEQYVSYPKPGNISIFETAGDGTLSLPQPLTLGQYELHEYEAGYGYVLNETPIPFEVTKADHEIEITFENTAAMGTISIEKTGRAFTGTTTEQTDYGDMSIPVFEETHLEGAVFEVRAEQDIRTPDGTTHLRAGEVADTLTTSAAENVTSKPLYLGKYIVVEISAPDGYLLDSTEHRVELAYKDQHTPLITEQVGLMNDRPAMELSLMKQAEMFHPHDVSTTLEPGDGFVFGLYASSEVKGIGDARIPKGMLVWYGVTAKDGALKADLELPYGEYILKEIKADGYILDKTEYPVSLPYGGQDSGPIQIVINDGEPIVNHLAMSKIRIIKTEDTQSKNQGILATLFGGGDNTPNRLEGAVFEIRSDALKIRLEVTTGSDGVVETGLLPGGTYTIREIKAPPGFLPSADAWTVDILENSAETIEITCPNSATEVVLLKIDAADGSPVAGAVLAVYDSAGKKIAEGTTGKDGKLTIRRLPAGTYYTYKEISPPDGYLKDETMRHFAIAENGSVSGETAFKNERAVIEIKKVAAGSGTVLPGAKFGLFNSSDKQVAAAVSGQDGLLRFERVPKGVWYIRELSAPAGYVVSGKAVKVEITDQYKNSVPIVVENAIAVQTGVFNTITSQITLFYILTLTCIAGVGVYIQYRKQKNVKK